MIKLKIELRGIGAKRVVIVPGDTTLESLHDVIQALFGWEDCHLWAFSNNKGQNVWQPPLPDSTVSECLDPSDFSVDDMLQKVGDHAEYEYDFGDSWRHRITRMADPKPGVGYGCVKSEGPDGEEDSRFSFADDNEPAEEEHIPTLDDVNGRMPPLESLAKLQQQVDLGKDARGEYGPGFVDVLSAKSAADLEIAATGMPITQGLSGDDLKKAIADFLGSDAGCKAAAEKLIISITEPYFQVFSEAAKAGSTLIKNVRMDDVCVFSKCPVTHIQRSGMRDVRLFVAKEVCEMWPKMCVHWCTIHRDWDTAHALADAAVRLYGGITVHEFAGILGRFYEKDEYPEYLLESVLGVRASCWDSMHFVEEGTIYGENFKSLSGYREFARKRDAYPRWETNDFNEFYDYADERFFENTAQREELVKFLMKTFGDSRNTAEGVADEVQRDLRDGESAEEIADEFSIDFLNHDMPQRKVAEIAALVRNVRDNMRLAEYNGNKFASLPPTSPVLRAKSKVGRNDPCPCGSGLKYKKCCVSGR